MGAIYLSALLISSACMLLIDWRHRLFFFKDAFSATIVTVVGVIFLLAWDAAGIVLGIFYRGGATIASGIVLAPEMPLEEPVFLAFLVLCTMVIFTGAQRLLSVYRRPAHRNPAHRQPDQRSTGGTHTRGEQS